jgi:hypothetical protein
MKKNVFFHKINNNTIVVKSQPLTSRKAKVNGIEVQAREQAQVTFGILVLQDAEGNTLNPATLGLKPNQELPGFRLSESPVLDMETGEATGLFWVEAY